MQNQKTDAMKNLTSQWTGSLVGHRLRNLYGIQHFNLDTILKCRSTHDKSSL